MQRAGVTIERGEAVSAVQVNFELGMVYSEHGRVCTVYTVQCTASRNCNGKASRKGWPATASSYIYAVST
jgi:hypothetical protein